MKKFSTLLVVLYCIAYIIQTSDAVLAECKDLVPQNVTLEDFAGSWTLVEDYLEFSSYLREDEFEQRKLLKSRCESANTSLAEPNCFINEKHLRGYSISKRDNHPIVNTRNISIIMQQIGVFKIVDVSFRGFTLIFIGINENKDYLTMAACKEQDWFHSRSSFQLTTFRSSDSDYNSTKVEEMREKIKRALEIEEITPLPYGQDCT